MDVIEFEEFNEDKVLQELLHETFPHALFRTYMEKGDVDLLREKLRAHGEVIEFTDDFQLVVGPDDKLFDIYTTESE